MLSRRRANALLLSLSILCLGLVAALGVVLGRRTPASSSADLALTDPAVRREVVARLVDLSYGGLYDSHPDGDVGRVFQPDVDRELDLFGRVRTNAFGLREKAYELPKPAGTVRVVLLGDSYVFGNMVAAEQRVGARLENMLRERAGAQGLTVECLHLGIPSWNIRAECAFLRRQITDYRPDLVVQVVVPNDLDDLEGVRGFGALATFSPQHRERAASLVRRDNATRLGFRSQNYYLLDGLDHESRSRYGQANADLRNLADVVAAAGGRYVLLMNWMRKLSVGRELLAAGLSDEQVAALPYAFYLDPAHRISAQDGHWNPSGHEQVARFLYACIQRRGLLPQLAPAAWDEADAVWDAFARQVADELDSPPPAAREPAPLLDLRQWTTETQEQVYGGIVGSLVAPYASVVLGGGGSSLQIEGEFLDTPALADATVRIYVDEVLLMSGPCRPPGKSFRLKQALPPELRGRSRLNVRFVTDDFVYLGDDRRETVSLFLATVGIVE